MAEAVAAFWLPGLWGKTPAGFERVGLGRAVALLRQAEAPLLFPALRSLLERDPLEPSALSGRGSLRAVSMGEERALVRPYRRGGWARYVTRDLFWSWPPRPFAELEATESARARGVPACEVLGALVLRAWGPFYRGWLVTRELAGARDLWQALLGEEGGPRRQLLEAAAESVAAMHRRGIYHGDLHLRNIVVRREGTRFAAYLLDFDKARILAEPLTERLAQRNLRRFLRSARKLDPERRRFSEADWRIFMAAYERGRNR